MKNILFPISLVTLSLSLVFEATSLPKIKSIKVEEGKTYHCDGKLSRKEPAYSISSFTCDLMIKDKNRQAPFEYVTTKKTVELRCPRKLAILSRPQYDEGYIYKYLVTCGRPQ
jgi:hypothetical protein